MTHPHLLTDTVLVKRFALAGAAKLTLVSRRTEARYTYRIAGLGEDAGRPGQRPCWFVALLAGPDNQADYVYLGTIFSRALGTQFRTTGKSRMTASSPPVSAFAYFADQVLGRGVMPAALEVWHEGACGACGRPLTVPASIELGFGPECAARLGLKLGYAAPELAL